MSIKETVSETSTTKGLLDKVSEAKSLIEKHYYRIDVIEKLLDKKEMEDDERKELVSELDALREILKQSEADLHSLHDNNKETTRLAAVFMFLVFGIYCIYSLFTNEN